MTNSLDEKQKKNLYLLTGLLILIVFLIAVDTFVPKREPVPEPKESITPYVATLQGEYVCLPHKGNGEFQTLECALGIKTDDGSHYALDAQMMENQDLLQAPVGTRIEVSGVLVPIELISNDFWTRYDIRGIMSVSAWKKL